MVQVIKISIWVKHHLRRTLEIAAYNAAHVMMCCTKPLSTIQCNKTLCRDQLVPILLIG